MKKKDIKKQSKDELSKNIDKLKKDLFNMRFQKINGQIKSTAQVRETKKSLARLKTYLGEKLQEFLSKKNNFEKFSPSFAKNTLEIS